MANPSGAGNLHSWGRRVQTNQREGGWSGWDTFFVRHVLYSVIGQRHLGTIETFSASWKSSAKNEEVVGELRRELAHIIVGETYS